MSTTLRVDPPCSRARTRFGSALRAVCLSLLVLATLLIALWPSSSLAQRPPASPDTAASPSLLSAPADMPDLAHEDLSQIVIPGLLPDFVVDDRGWIRFAFPKTESHRIPELIEAADDVRGALASELGNDALEHVEVRLARTPTEMAALAPASIPPPGYAAGVAYARLRLVILSIEAPHPAELPNLGEVFRHELAHIGLFDAVHGRPMPRWFNEGYAIHASGESSLRRARTLWGATSDKQLIALSELDRSFPDDGDHAALAFAQSADFVGFLLRRQDRGHFRNLIGRVAEGEPFDRAVGDAYSSNLRGLEFEWREQLKGRHRYVPTLLGGGVVCALGLVVAVLVWVRKRRRHKVTLARRAHEEAVEEARKSEALQEVMRIKLIPRPPMMPQVYVVEPPATRATPAAPPAEQDEPSVPAMRPDVPKIAHDGRWHTLH